MIRYTVILLAALGTVAAAAAFQEAPAAQPGPNSRPALVNETVVAKNGAYPVLDTEGWVACKTDDCSDVPNQ